MLYIQYSCKLPVAIVLIVMIIKPAESFFKPGALLVS